MKNFEIRRDRFEFFENFESPLLNLTIHLETPDFTGHCKRKNIPVFHFFLFCVMKSINELDHFKYRIVKGEVIKNEVINGSYTVLNEQNLFNYTFFNYSDDLQLFLAESLRARRVSTTTKELLNTAIDTMFLSRAFPGLILHPFSIPFSNSNLQMCHQSPGGNLIQLITKKFVCLFQFKFIMALWMACTYQNSQTKLAIRFFNL
jgi:chloramphenicol O-acetyltransferase